MAKTTVVHLKKDKFDVKICRPTMWGNPFSHLEGTLAEYKVATREEAVAAYRTWIMAQPDMLARARAELRGKVLGCWCKPQLCHGDVLAEIADSEPTAAERTTPRTLNADFIDEHFPMPQYRRLQREIIERIIDTFNEGYKFVFVEAPTGSGKSAIGFTIAQMMKSTYYLAPQKFLQDQLCGDFGEAGAWTGKHTPMIDLKGRNAYPCDYWSRALQDPDFDWGNDFRDKQVRYRELAKRGLGCDEGQCKRDGQSKLKYCVDNDIGKCVCPYYVRMRQARAAKICLMNFHSFLFQTAVVQSFHPREFLLLDEAHNTEDVLMKFVEMRISDRHFATLGVRFPQYNTPKEYIEFFQEIHLEDKIMQKIQVARLALNIKEEDEWTNQLLRYKILLDANPDEWVSIWEEASSLASRTVILKPIFIDAFADEYLFSKAKYVLMMSATILHKEAFCDALGIRDKVRLLRLPNLFPLENRPIFFQPSGAMSYNSKKETMPKLIADVEYICRHHQDHRGIIHTHTFEICETLLDNCAPDVRCRFLYQRDAEFENDKQQMLAKHKASKNSILIAPAMHEGLDLKDDLGRFQVLCKVPYPSKNDPQMAARMEISKDYYDWRTAIKIVQSYGRCIRHDEDWAYTYILDEDFKKFVNRCTMGIENILPKWFLEAIVWNQSEASAK